MKIALVVPVLNEERSVGKLIDSIARQTIKPSEIIFVDGGSKDKTVEEVIKYSKKVNLKVKVLVKKGNRSIARNFGVESSKSDVIVLTDAGCTLDKNWLKEIIKPFKYRNADVVAGYYKGEAKNVFQKCLIPYVLIMDDKVNPKTFLPATRSMAFRKRVWKKLGGFPKKYSHNEDYVFANLLKRNNITIHVQTSAIVNWVPRKNILEAFYMFYRFALGDSQAQIFRPKVLLLLLRYIIAVLLLFLSPKLLTFILILYLVWAVIKNYNYVKDYRAIFILPSLQIISDIAVISGTVVGLFKND